MCSGILFSAFLLVLGPVCTLTLNTAIAGATAFTMFAANLSTATSLRIDLHQPRHHRVIMIDFTWVRIRLGIETDITTRLYPSCPTSRFETKLSQPHVVDNRRFFIFCYYFERNSQGLLFNLLDEWMSRHAAV